MPGSEEPCACDSAPGTHSCRADGSGFDVCKNGGMCCGSPGGWLGCETNGCAVCAELVVGFAHYFDNHPDCYSQTACNPGYGKCSEACPQPSTDDL